MGPRLSTDTAGLPSGRTEFTARECRSRTVAPLRLVTAVTHILGTATRGVNENGGSEDALAAVAGGYFGWKHRDGEGGCGLGSQRSGGPVWMLSTKWVQSYPILVRSSPLCVAVLQRVDPGASAGFERVSGQAAGARGWVQVRGPVEARSSGFCSAGSSRGAAGGRGSGTIAWTASTPKMLTAWRPDGPQNTASPLRKIE